jgi:hypothetical protein
MAAARNISIKLTLKDYFMGVRDVFCSLVKKTVKDYELCSYSALFSVVERTGRVFRHLFCL